MGANNLKSNIYKTLLLRTTTRQQGTANGWENLTLKPKDSNGKNISPSISAKLLGLTFNKNLNLNDHFLFGEKTVSYQYKKSLGALKFTCSKARIAAKKELAESDNT